MMPHINISFQTLELLFKISMQEGSIVRVSKHPMLGRTLMVEFLPGRKVEESLSIPTASELPQYPIMKKEM